MRIADHIRAICAIVEEHGPCGLREIAARLPHLQYSNVCTHCKTATLLGMLDVQEGSQKKNDRNIYTILPGWQDVEIVRPTTVKPAKMWLRVPSVFQPRL